MPFSVAGSLDRYVESIREDRVPDGKHHPSSMFGCLRQATYAKMGVEQTNPPDARSQRVFRMGHIFHDFIQTAIEQDPEVEEFYRELKVDEPDLDITGHMDGVARLATGEWLPLEFKSIGGYGFKKKDLPQADHVSQFRTYMLGLRDRGVTVGEGPEGSTRLFVPKLTRGLIVYVNKETMEVKEFSVFLTAASERAIIDRVKSIDLHVLDGTLPERLPVDAKGKKDWHCGYCPYAARCWEQDE